MTRTFKPDDRIAHYRIVGPLGAGGMGEVHIAHDEKLGRSVALKVLPPGLVRNEERVRRFITEARSASTLNHPNIVTIYEIGHDRVVAGDAAGDDDDDQQLHYIAMELVTGETLDQKIHRERVDLRTLVSYLAQVAEGVAKAHAAGVVHRDLKPGNIMVSKDGFAKVLDFGLAKLIEREATAKDDLTSAPTAGAATLAGVVLGTVGYMSPEQVQAHSADHRSDIFSMGVILYEAAARRRPFVSDSDVEVMHQILRDQPPPLEELNPEVPTALHRLIRRCLAKSPEQRLQSMKDLAIELRQIFDEWDSLNVTSSVSAAPSATAVSSSVASRGPRTWLVTAAAVVAAVGMAIGFMTLRRQSPPATPPAMAGPQLQMSSLMSRSDLQEAALSADGRYLAFVAGGGGRNRLSVLQVRTGSEVTILEDSPDNVTGIGFSPDGDYLFYRNRDTELPNYSALFQVPSLGGTPRKVVFDVDSSVSFSADGTRVCFRRGVIDQQADSLVIAELASGTERELLRVDLPTRFRGHPAWSPDGRTIAAALQTTAGGVRAWVEAIDAVSGTRTLLGEPSWQEIDSLAWLPGGGALVVSAWNLATGVEPQLYRLAVPGGAAMRITSDLDGYLDVSSSAETGAVVAVRRSTVSNMWVAHPDEGNRVEALTFASGSAASMGQIAPLPGAATAYTGPRDNRFYLWRIDADGSDRRQLTTVGVWVFNAAWAPGAGIVFTQLEENPAIVGHVWRVAPDGSGLEQLTRGSGEQMLDLSPTGDALLFQRWEQPDDLWALRLDGSEPFLVARGAAEGVRFSPDGLRVLYGRIEDLGDGRFFPARYVASLDRPESTSRFLLPAGAFDLEWEPSGAAITYVDRQQGWNLMRWDLTAGTAEPVTSLSEGRVVGHRWHADGSRLILHRRFGEAQSLWQLEAGAREPSLVTEYKTGRLSRYQWAPDAPLLYYAYSTSSQDVVEMTGVE